jgi:mitochondrial cardiolipin hydrolase
MDREQLDNLFTEMIADRHLSRSESRIQREVLAVQKTDADRHHFRQAAFAAARTVIVNSGDLSALDWLESVVRLLLSEPTSAEAQGASTTTAADAYFSPKDDCARVLTRLIEASRRSVDVCVFTITDDRLSDALITAHRRGVALRVITDDDKAADLGSDIGRLSAAGVAVRQDRSPFHMHHKFAIYDGRQLSNGSYNWTRGAARDNQENLIVCDEPRLLSAFSAAFERLWTGLV